MEQKPDRKLTGRAALEKTLRLFRSLQKDLLLADSADVTITQTVRDGLIKTMFNISGLNIEFTVNQNEV